MRKEQRLRKRGDFSAVYRACRPLGDQLLVVRSRPTGGEISRFGFVTPKAIGGAVVRNRVRRRLRAAAGACRVRPGLDLVVSAKKPAAEATYQSLAASLEKLLRRAGALSEAAESPAGAQEQP